MIHTTKLMNIQNYKLNERNQSQKTTFYINIECPEHIFHKNIKYVGGYQGLKEERGDGECG